MKRRGIPKNIRQAVWARAQGRCEACGYLLLEDFWECHHRRLRSQQGKNELPNLVALCQPCHIRAHSERESWGVPGGWIVPSWASWAQTPVTLWDGRKVWLAFDGGYELVAEAS